MGTLAARLRFSEAVHLNPNNPKMDCCTGIEGSMHSIIYLVGLVVVVMFILSLLGIH